MRENDSHAIDSPLNPLPRRVQHQGLGSEYSAALREDVVRYVKAVSSRWVHEEIGEHSFAWQGGETPPPRVAPFANPS